MDSFLDLNLPFAASSIGHSLQSHALAILPGQMIELNTQGLNTLGADSLYPNEGRKWTTMQDWCINGLWWPEKQMAVIAGAPHGGRYDKGASTGILVYEAIENRWRIIRNPWSIASGHCYSSSAVDPESGILYKAHFGTKLRIARFDLSTMSPMSNLPGPGRKLGRVRGGWSGVHALAWHPEFGESGALFHVNSAYGRVHCWDKTKNKWFSLFENLVIKEVEPVAHFHPVSKVMVIGSNRRGPMYLVKQDGTIQKTQGSPANVFPSNSFVPDPGSINSLIFTNSGRIYSLNTLTGEWQSGAKLPDMLRLRQPPIEVTAAYSIQEHNVILFQQYKSQGRSKVFLYRHS